MNLETSTINVLLTALIGLQTWVVITVAEMRVEIRRLKERVG